VLGPGPAPDVAWRRVDVQTEPELHRRYRIDGVPTTVVADADGVVLQAFFGPLSPGQLTETLARAGVSR
jgi:thioredoxin-like negative regulator of GroEL